ncbi:MAG: rRNA pseudouridine synthase [Holosporales bacterium]|jgi:23S rRNA pseudouridine2605 synthase|nr:rRNA pseudouridine synthase [Holosporales bacterium]
MSVLGICSRRDADRLISSGKVMVNGEVIAELGAKISHGDTVSVSGMNYVFTTNPTCRTWIYYKPVGLVTSNRDPQGRTTVFEDIAGKIPERVVSVGRLDINSEGLLILTNNGELARYLELPATALERRYKVRLFGTLGNDTISQFAKGINVDGMHYAPVRVRLLRRSSGKNCWVECILTEGKNREIRKLFSHFGLSVNKLIRTHYGPYSIGDLKPGEIREVESLHL